MEILDFLVYTLQVADTGCGTHSPQQLSVNSIIAKFYQVLSEVTVATGTDGSRHVIRYVIVALCPVFVLFVLFTPGLLTALF